MIKQIFEKSFTRESSIQLLKEAVANKTLSCYDKTNIECEYVNKKGQNCAVGALMRLTPEESEWMKDGEIDLSHRKQKVNGYKIGGLIGCSRVENAYGLESYELDELQSMHDKVIHARHNEECRQVLLGHFEEHINNLV